MDDPQRELKQWLAEKVSPHGEAKKLAEATGLSSDKITRSKELESTDPKKRRTLQYEEIRAIAMHFRELPPGYEGMKAWLRDADATHPRSSPSIIPSYDPDDDGNGYHRDHWKPAMPGAIPEIDAKLGAGEGAVGEIVNLPVGDGAYSGHRVVAEWILSETFLRHEAKASRQDTVIMEIIGDSMAPTYGPGDRVLVDQSQTRLVADTVYAISDGYGEPQIKRLQRIPFSDPAMVKIISDNPTLASFDVQLDRLTIIGRVCGHIARK